MKQPASRARNAVIVDRIRQGARVAQLADEYDLTPQYIYALLRSAGVKPAPPQGKRLAVVAELHSLGLSGGAAARVIGVPRTTIYRDAKHLGLKFPYDASRWAEGGRSSQQRAAKMAALYRSGMTLQQIGDKYGISRERVRQLMTKHEGVRHDGGGQHVKAVAGRQRRKAEKDARYLKKYGCTFEQYRQAREVGRLMRAAGCGVYQTPLRAFINQKNNAKARKIPWELSFWQWWTIWQESGKWAQRGRAKDAFVMSRFADSGAYAVGNIYIGTLSENSSVQPNNPYRRDHPDHDKVLQKRGRAAKECSVDGCTKPHFGRGYCNNHYYHFVTKPARGPEEQVAA